MFPQEETVHLGLSRGRGGVNTTLTVTAGISDSRSPGGNAWGAVTGHTLTTRSPASRLSLRILSRHPPTAPPPLVIMQHHCQCVHSPQVSGSSSSSHGRDGQHSLQSLGYRRVSISISHMNKERTCFGYSGLPDSPDPLLGIFLSP